MGSLAMFDSTFHRLRTKIQDWWQENTDEHYERLGAKQGMSLIGPWKVVKQGSLGEMFGWWLVREVEGSNGKQVDNNNSIWSVVREVYTSLMNSCREKSSWRYLTVRYDRRFFGHLSFTVIAETIIVIIVFRGWFLVRWNIGMITIYLCIGLKICPGVVDHRCGLENTIITIRCLAPDEKSPRQSRCSSVRMRRTLPNHRHARSFLGCGWLDRLEFRPCHCCRRSISSRHYYCSMHRTKERAILLRVQRLDFQHCHPSHRQRTARLKKANHLADSSHRISVIHRVSSLCLRVLFSWCPHFVCFAFFQLFPTTCTSNWILFCFWLILDGVFSSAAGNHDDRYESWSCLDSNGAEGYAEWVPSTDISRKTTECNDHVFSQLVWVFLMNASFQVDFFTSLVCDR